MSKRKPKKDDRPLMTGHCPLPPPVKAGEPVPEPTVLHGIAVKMRGLPPVTIYAGGDDEQ